MKKVVLLTLIGTLAFVSEGCSIFSKFSESQKELEENAVKPIPVRVNNAQTQPQDTSEVFADLEEEEAEPLPEIAGLIPATDPEARIRSSVRGRNDPFSIVALNPRIQIEEQEEKNDRTIATRTSRNNNNDSNSNSNSNRLDLPFPAEVFEPTLAQEVVVSGLFEADGRTRLIVQAPEESTSRYVEVGQYLSNGQVLVKRIEQNGFSGPTIILEQSGMEVAKTIGGNLDEGENISSLPSETPTQVWSTAVSLK